MKKYQIIEIEWFDSLHVSGWKEEKDIELTTKEEMLHRTVGYFLKEDDKSIIVVQSRNELKAVDAIMEIPKGCIIKKKLIK